MEIPANNLIEHIGCWLVIIARLVIIVYLIKLIIASIKHCDNRKNEKHEKQMQEARLGKIAEAVNVVLTGIPGWQKDAEKSPKTFRIVEEMGDTRITVELGEPHSSAEK